MGTSNDMIYCALGVSIQIVPWSVGGMIIHTKPFYHSSKKKKKKKTQSDTQTQQSGNI